MPAKRTPAPVKPTYAVMVAESIKTIGDRTGSSVQAITKQVTTQYKIDINKPALIKAIKKGVEAGELVQVKASYKLAKKGSIKPKKPAPPTTKPPAKVRAVKTKPAPRPAPRAAAPKPKKTITKRTAAPKKTPVAATKKTSVRKAPTKRTTATTRKAAKK